MASDTSVRVLQIISSFYPIIGGAERATAVLSESLNRTGHLSTILTRWYPGLPRIEQQSDVTVVRLGISGPLKIGAISFILHTILWILVKGQSYSILHTQNLDAPLVVAALVRLLTRKPWVATIHGEWEIPNRQRKLLGRIRLAVMFRLSNKYIAISKANYEAMLEAGILEEKIACIPNAVDTSYMRPATLAERKNVRHNMNYHPEDVIILYLGRLVFRKRPDLLLTTLAMLDKHSIRCIVAGNGDERSKLETLVDRNSLRNCVEFVGFVDNVRDYFWLSDIFVLPSQYEGLPVALLEGMACGIAVLASACDGNREIVNNNINGLTFAVDDDEALLSQLKTLLGSRTLRKHLGSNARKTIVEQYGITQITERHIEFYTSVLINDS